MADLITLSDYKDMVGTTSSEEDTMISALIPAVSQLVKTYCDTTFVDHYSSAKTEIFSPRFAVDTIYLSEYPVNSITSVEERTTYGSDYDTLTTASKEYYLDEELDALVRTNASGFKSWPIGPGAVKVVYTGGYSTIPGDLKLVVVDLIDFYRHKEHKPRRTSGASHMENPPKSSMRNTAEWPDHIKRVLDLYKNSNV